MAKFPFGESRNIIVELTTWKLCLQSQEAILVLLNIEREPSISAMVPG